MRLSMIRAALLVFVLLRPAGGQNPPAMSARATQYLDRAFDLMGRSPLYRKQVDLRTLRQDAERYVAGAQQPWQTYPAIAYACAKPHAGFCRLMLPEDTPGDIRERCQTVTMAFQRGHGSVPLRTASPSPFFDRAFLYAKLVNNGRQYDYIVVPESVPRRAAFGDPAGRHQWAETLSGMIARGEAERVQGWILDLRGNTGGYIGPMLAGVQSLLGEGTVLMTRGPGHKGSFSVGRGQIIRRIDHRSSVEEHLDEPVTYPKVTLPVVLLQDRVTEAAAESLLIAFKGRRNTAFIGKRTAGYVQNGTYWDLTDGATLWIAEEDVFDRNGLSYSEGLQPDFEVEDPPSRTRIDLDPAVLKAEEWLSHLN